MGYAYLFPAIGLMYLFITNKDKKETKHLVKKFGG